MVHRFFTLIGGIGVLLAVFGIFHLELIPVILNAPHNPAARTSTSLPQQNSKVIVKPSERAPEADPTLDANAELSSETEPPATPPPPVQKQTAELTPQIDPTPIVHETTSPQNTPPPLSTEILNTKARAALVNIFCTSNGGSLNPISGSGVIIDPKGVVLTNAHVAQYVLLSKRTEIRLTCSARTGSPASSPMSLNVLYIPERWVREHVSEITTSRAKGTGESDYALLVVTGPVSGSDLSGPLPYLVPNTVPFSTDIGDSVLLAAYPAEFSGGLTTQNALYASSAVTTVKKLYTFADNSADLMALGGTVVAQSGSSGGAVVNSMAELIGIITTTSDGQTTGDRDLRAITLSYVDQDLSRGTGSDLASFLEGDPISKSIRYMTQDAPALIELYLAQLK